MFLFYISLISDLTILFSFIYLLGSNLLFFLSSFKMETKEKSHQNKRSKQKLSALEKREQTRSRYSAPMKQRVGENLKG